MLDEKVLKVVKLCLAKIGKLDL